ncbi:MAG: AbiV family abortive infection protein [Chloroflexi bacterium]|nr:AbiV family abortive infection protein [Chloroflexota bacterium]
MVERLSKEQIRVLLELCLQNAEELIGEADILLQAGKYARATGLCIIAMEELGKRTTLWRAIGFGEDETEWKAFWRRFRQHEVKISYILSEKYSVVMDPRRFEEFERQAAQAGVLTSARKYAFYVDVLRGKPHLPSASFTKKKAVTAFKSAHAHLRLHQELYPTDRGLELAEKWGNRRKGETHRQWAERVFGKDIPPALEKMVDEYDKAERKA